MGILETEIREQSAWVKNSFVEDANLMLEHASDILYLSSESNKSRKRHAHDVKWHTMVNLVRKKHKLGE